MRLRVLAAAALAVPLLATGLSISPATSSPTSPDATGELVRLGLERLARPASASATGVSTAGAGAAPSSTADGRPDPLGDVVALSDGTQTIEPRADLSRVDFNYGADRLDVTVTIPGGVDPTSSPNWQKNLSGIVAAFDVNGDDNPDFASVLAIDANGKIEVITIRVPPSPAPNSRDAFRLAFCRGAGAFDGAARTYKLSVPSACLGNAYEVRGAAAIIFNRATTISEKIDLTIDIAPSTNDLPGVHRDTQRNGAGYRFVARDGGIFSFGNAPFFGSTGDIRLNQPIVGMDTTRTGAGYWLVASDGGIFTFGDAPFFGSTGDIRLNEPIVGLAVTPTGLGYWLVARDGGIFTFGDAAFHGSPAGAAGTSIVGMAATPSGHGYWIATASGAVLPYGDATLFTSTAAMSSASVVGISATPSGRGYWLAYSDGGVSPRGDAANLGEAVNLKLNAPIVGLASTPTGRGYWLLGRDGGVFSYGDAAFHGSTGNLTLNQPVLDLSA